MIDLPTILTGDDQRRMLADHELWLRAAREICLRHALPADELQPLTDGSTIVVAIGADRVVKLFEPRYADMLVTERTILEYLEGKLPIRTPALEQSGDLEGWPYLIMQRIPGRQLSEVWDDMVVRDRLAMARTLGESLATLHALPVPARDGIVDRWDTFETGQRAGCTERQRRAGLGEEWLRLIPEFLASIQLDRSGRHALLHTEVMREHLFAEPTAAGWRLSGLIDFEPSMPGDPEYEFASVGLFVSKGDGAILRATLLGYGYRPEDLTPELQQRLMAHTLIHRYSNLPWYFGFMPEGGRALTFAGLASWWFGVNDA